MSTFISDIVDEDVIACEVCKETFKADEITTDDFNFAWDNLVTTDCCSSCFPKVRREDCKQTGQDLDLERMLSEVFDKVFFKESEV